MKKNEKKIEGVFRRHSAPKVVGSVDTDGRSARPKWGLSTLRNPTGADRKLPHHAAWMVVGLVSRIYGAGSADRRSV